MSEIKIGFAQRAFFYYIDEREKSIQGAFEDYEYNEFMTRFRGLIFTIDLEYYSSLSMEFQNLIKEWSKKRGIYKVYLVSKKRFLEELEFECTKYDQEELFKIFQDLLNNDSVETIIIPTGSTADVTSFF